MTLGVCLMVCTCRGRVVVVVRFDLIVVVLLCFAGPREAAAWCTRAVLNAVLCTGPREVVGWCTRAVLNAVVCAAPRLAATA